MKLMSKMPRKRFYPNKHGRKLKKSVASLRKKTRNGLERANARTMAR